MGATAAAGVKSPTVQQQDTQGADAIDSLFDTSAAVPKGEGAGKFAELPVGPIKDINHELDIDGDGKPEDVQSGEAIDRDGDGVSDAVVYKLGNGNSVEKDAVDLDGDGELDGVRLSVSDPKGNPIYSSLKADLDGDGHVDLEAERRTKKDGSTDTKVSLEAPDGSSLTAEVAKDAKGNVESVATTAGLDTDGNGKADMFRSTYDDARVSVEQTAFDPDENGSADAFVGTTRDNRTGTSASYMGADLDGDGMFSEKEVVKTGETHEGKRLARKPDDASSLV